MTTFSLAELFFPYASNMCFLSTMYLRVKIVAKTSGILNFLGRIVIRKNRV